MLLFSVALYFLLAAAISWMVVFPAGRAFVAQALAGAGQRLQQRASRLARRQVQSADAQLQSGKAWLGRSAAFLRRHYLVCIGGAALVLLPPTLALLSGSKPMLGGFAPSTRETNSQVTALLQGEQLAPPAALPPLAFTTAEVRQERPMLGSASRDWARLDPVYTQRLLAAFKIMKERYGYDMAILEGYRSPERQNMLAAMGSSVTNAAAFQSWHQYGLAADCAFLRGGRLVISEKDPWAMRGYQLFGEVSESLGLTWGGRWKMMDFGHTELRRPGMMKR